MITFYVGGHALYWVAGSRLGLNSGPAAHCARHALLDMAPNWSSHWTTWAGCNGSYFALFHQIR